MSKMLNTAQAAIEWVTETRQRSVRLDDEADALLTQLTLAAVNESALTATFSARGCVGLYGIHNQQKRICSRIVQQCQRQSEYRDPGSQF